MFHCSISFNTDNAYMNVVTDKAPSDIKTPFASEPSLSQCTDSFLSNICLPQHFISFTTFLDIVQMAFGLAIFSTFCFSLNFQQKFLAEHINATVAVKICCCSYVYLTFFRAFPCLLMKIRFV